MHDTSKIGSFMALRANGWSLAKISKELNVSKSTLWEWDNKQQNEIHLLKHLQLEKLQERYLPTYEEELSKLRSYLDRLENALETQDFNKMGPEYVLQMALQLRARLGKMREQVPLRNIPFNQPLAPLPFTGCVSRQDAQTFRKEFFEGQSVEDPADPVAVPRPPCRSSEAKAGESADSPIGARTACPPEASNTPEESTPTGNDLSAVTPEKVEPLATDTTPDPLRELRASVVNSENTNRTFPDETPPGSKIEPLKINGFHKPDPNGRPVSDSENGHANGNGKPAVNGNGHHQGTNGSRRDLNDSRLNPPQPADSDSDAWEITDHVSETGVRLAFPKRKKQ